MKTRKDENNPVIRKEELDAVRKSVSNYLTKEYPNWLKEVLEDEVRAFIKAELEKKPDWLIKIIKNVISSEIKRNLKINISGWNNIEVSLNYNGINISSSTKYHPRG